MSFFVVPSAEKWGGTFCIPISVRRSFSFGEAQARRLIASRSSPPRLEKKIPVLPSGGKAGLQFAISRLFCTIRCVPYVVLHVQQYKISERTKMQVCGHACQPPRRSVTEFEIGLRGLPEPILGRGDWLLGKPRKPIRPGTTGKNHVEAFFVVHSTS